MSHYMKKCTKCGTVYDQCRCPGPKAVEYGVCQKCASSEEDNNLLGTILPITAAADIIACDVPDPTPDTFSGFGGGESGGGGASASWDSPSDSGSFDSGSSSD